MSKIEEACQLSKHSFEEAQGLFKNSVDRMPSPWTIFGMNVLEGLIGVVGAFCPRYQMGDAKNVCDQEMLPVLSLPSQHSQLRRSARPRGAELVITPNTLKRMPPRQD